MKSSLRRSSLGILITCVGLAMVCYAVLRKEFVSLFWGLFFLGLVILILLSHALHHLLLHTRRKLYKVSFPYMVQVYEQIPITIESCQFKTISPFFYCLELIASFPSRPKQTLTISLESNDKTQEFVWQLPWRGSYHIEIFLASWDIFGFFYERIPISVDEKIEVAPTFPQKPLALLNTVQENLNGMATGKAHFSSPEAIDTREYYPGDDPRRINWKQSMRFHKLFVRQENLHQPLVHHIRYVVFPPPLTKEGPDLLDHLINVMLQLIASYPHDIVQTSLVIGTLFLENFNLTSLIDRSRLSLCYAGMVYESDKNLIACDGPVIFLGCASDPLFLDALRKYHHILPLLFITDSQAQQQTVQNVIFLAKSLKMDVYHV